MLELDTIHAYYGESHVLQGVSLAADKGKIIALLGRNGAGKTTTLCAITGLTPARHGQIRFCGRDITRQSPFAIARAGIGYIPAGRRLFADLTVGQNLRLGQRPVGPDGWTIERVHTLFPKLAELNDRPARALSGGEQQMLKFGRCLLGQPKLLLIDEPSEGLGPIIVRQVATLLSELRQAGLSMLICEQNAQFALKIADTAYLMEKGRIRQGGSAAEMAAHPELKEFLAI